MTMPSGSFLTSQHSAIRERLLETINLDGKKESRHLLTYFLSSTPVLTKDDQKKQKREKTTKNLVL